MKDVLIGKTVIRKGIEFRVTKVDRTCYHENHSPNDPWVILKNDAGEQSIGCLSVVAPELM